MPSSFSESPKIKSVMVTKESQLSLRSVPFWMASCDFVMVMIWRWRNAGWLHIHLISFCSGRWIFMLH